MCSGGWARAGAVAVPAVGSTWLISLRPVLSAVVDVLVVEGGDQVDVDRAHVLLFVPGHDGDLGGHVVVFGGYELDLFELGFLWEGAKDALRLQVEVVALRARAAIDRHDVAVLRAG